MLSAERSLIGGWALGPVVGRRPAGPLREAIEPLTRRRAMFVLVDERFQPAVAPDPDAVIRAASVDHSGIAPMLDAGLLDDGTPWYVCDPLPGPVLDPNASRSPRRALVLAEDVAQALAALHADGVAHGLVGPLTVIPGGGRHGGEPTMLLDAGVGALVGSAAPTLAAACGASLPGDRGPAADVYALGALLLRLLTNAASPSAALAALPMDVRALLSSLLDPDPARRPTAGATAARLARLREQVPATGAIPLVRASAPAPAPAPAAGPARAPAPAPRAPVASFAPPTASASSAPVPVSAARTARSLIVLPRPVTDLAPALRTGPVTVRTDPFPPPPPLRAAGLPMPRQRRRTARRVLVASGGVALAGLLVAVVAHLPSSQEAGVHAIAAGADDAVVAVGAGTGGGAGTDAGSRSIPTAIASARPVAPTARSSASPVVSSAPLGAVATPTPAFLRPVVTATPLSAAGGAGPRPTTVVSTIPSSTTPSSTTPSSTTPSSTTPSSTEPSSTTPSSTAPSTTTPSSAMPSPSPDPSTPTATESTAPAETPTPAATPDDSTTPSATPSMSESPTPTDSASPSNDATTTPEPTATP